MVPVINFKMIDSQERCHRTETTILFVKDSEYKMSRSMPITISEDSDDETHLDVKSDSSIRPRRCLSLPANIHKLKSIMKRRTLDESLHSTYGSDDEVISGRSKKHIKLRFGLIKIREYSRTIGDNPSCSSGPPISISWEYIENENIRFEDYEKMRPPRRVQNEMILPRLAREDMLRLEWNASRKEIIESVRRNVRVKNQRRTTINNLDKATKLEVAMESASRKLKRFLTGQKAVHKQVQEMEDALEAFNRKQSKFAYLEHSMSQVIEGLAPKEKASLILNGSDHVVENSENLQ